MSRPKTPIDKDEFIKLCKMQCTLNEVASFFDCSHDTIERWCKDEFDGAKFGDVFEFYRAGGLISLRRNQFKLSEKYPAMAIWLGKQLLGQKDIISINSLDDGEDDPLTASIKSTLPVKVEEE